MPCPIWAPSAQPHPSSGPDHGHRNHRNAALVGTHHRSRPHNTLSVNSANHLRSCTISMPRCCCCCCVSGLCTCESTHEVHACRSTGLISGARRLRARRWNTWALSAMAVSGCAPLTSSCSGASRRPSPPPPKRHFCPPPGCQARVLHPASIRVHSSTSMAQHHVRLTTPAPYQGPRSPEIGTRLTEHVTVFRLPFTLGCWQPHPGHDNSRPLAAAPPRQQHPPACMSQNPPASMNEYTADKCLAFG